VQDKKWESVETRLRLKQQHFLYPFSVLHNRQCQKWDVVKNKVKSNDLQQQLEKLVPSRLIDLMLFLFAVEFHLRLLCVRLRFANLICAAIQF